eukprot:115322-Rhodomonas_salina.1
MCIRDSLYGEGAAAAGYHGARIETTIYPWVQSGYTTPAITERLWQRFVTACKELERTWEHAGLGHALSCPVADSWSAYKLWTLAVEAADGFPAHTHVQTAARLPTKRLASLPMDSRLTH